MKKKWWFITWVFTVFILLLNASSVYKYEVKTPPHQVSNLDMYKGKVTLIVNIASHSVYTPQLSGFEKLFSSYRSRGFTVLGFPTNQFKFQEPLAGRELEQFCKQKYGVTFPIFVSEDVSSVNANSLYHYLKTKGGILSKNEPIEWNFTKYLIDRNGLVIRRYSPRVKPEEIAADIEKIL